MPFLTKKKSTSSTSSASSAGNYTSQPSSSFVKFDEKKDYVRRCSIKGSCGDGSKHCPTSVSFCLGSKH